MAQYPHHAHRPLFSGHCSLWPFVRAGGGCSVRLRELYVITSFHSALHLPYTLLRIQKHSLELKFLFSQLVPTFRHVLSFHLFFSPLLLAVVTMNMPGVMDRLMRIWPALI
jgi:hypothetical protein